MKNIFLLTFLSLSTFIFFSCKKSVEKIDNGLITKDTIIFKENEVLFISPNDQEIKRLKKKLGDDFYTIADDANFYSANATEYMDSLHVKYINATNDAIIGYKKGSKFIKISKYENPWYVILFRSGKYKIVDLVDFEEQYNSFFNNPS